MKTKILAAKIAFTRRNFLKPLRLSSGPIRNVTEAVASVTVSVDGKEATGRGAIYLSDVWSWPHPTLSHEDRDNGMREFCFQTAINLAGLCGGEAVHPLSLGMRLHKCLQEERAADGPPLLSRLVCGSPFDAAIHDAVGIALSRSAFSLYDIPFDTPEADDWFTDGNASAAIKRTLRAPVLEHDAWLTVGPDDSVGDIASWVHGRGYYCFKLKLPGRDNAIDVQRTRAVFHLVRKWGAKTPRLAVDANCACSDAIQVLDYLERLQKEDPEAYTALEYLEQPTGRDILQFPNNWSAVTKHKPVILDEGLMSMEGLKEAKAQGWSGIAIKTCRGHSFSLVAAAAYAQEQGMLLALQDLTNPGIAAIHAALIASYLPVFNGLELNSPQYTPEANARWLPRLAPLLETTNGKHSLPATLPIGLGSNL